MKLIEPISSALLVTGCIYAAGVAQNASFMHVFGVNPAFSQPAIDKIFYDGGIITFELFIKHSIIASLILLAVALIALTAISLRKLIKRTTFSVAATPTLNFGRAFFDAMYKMSHLLVLAYLIFLTFSSFEKAQLDGEKISKAFIETCHVVVIKKDDEEIRGCAFNKDRDSIWYINAEGDTPKANSKSLSEIDYIRYLDPVKF